MIPTSSLQVLVILSYWASKPYTTKSGEVVPPGWRKPVGWPKKGSEHEDGGLDHIHPNHKKNVVTRTLKHALTRSAGCPAFLVGYRPTTIGFRLRTSAVSPLHIGMTRDAGGVVMQLALLDVDAPNHGQDVDVEAWWEAEKSKVMKLQADMPGIIAYRSQNGYRLVGALEQPFEISGYDAAFAWKDLYMAWVTCLGRVYGIEADRLADWTRFQGIPRMTKEKGQPCLNLEILGDTDFIGYWKPALIPEDYPQKVIHSTDHHEWSGECQLLRLIRMSSLSHEQVAPGAWDIHCPNHMAHSETEHRATKTILFTNGPIGKIECKSSSCSASHVDKGKSYLRHFPPAQVLLTSPWNWSDHPEVQRIIEKRIHLQSEATLETMSSDGIDETYEELLMAIQAAGTTQKDRRSRTPEDYARFAEWFVDQSTFSKPNESAYQAYLLSLTSNSE